MCGMCSGGFPDWKAGPTVTRKIIGGADIHWGMQSNCRPRGGKNADKGGETE